MYVYYTIHILVLVHSIVNSDPGLPIRCPAEQINTSGRISPKTKKKVSSWSACAQLCRERVGCRYWTWHHGHTCVTMMDAAKLDGNPGAVSGNRDCREKLKLKIGCPANLVNTWGRVGGVTTDVKTWEECAKLCQKRSSCRYWTWHHDKTPHLYLRYKCVTMTDAASTYGNPDTVSGTRDCPGNDEEEGGNAAIIFNAELHKLYRIMIVHENSRCIKFEHKVSFRTICKKYDEQASYFSVTINGVQVGKVKSRITKHMANVNVYAGDNYLPAADAKYNNLIWEEISGGI